MGERPVDGAVAFFVEMVEPTVQEFLAEPLNLRRARLAAIVVYHMAEYFFIYGNQNFGTIGDDKSIERHVADLAGSSSDFDLIRHVANASKHARLTRSRRIISDSRQLEARRPEWGQLPWGEFRGDGGEQILVLLDDGTARGFEVPLLRVMEMWREKLTLRQPRA